MKLEEQETQLKGNWLTEGSSIIADDISRRINWLIQNYLAKITQDESGWFILYRDPEDGRYWELSYPQGHLQGGGAPSLINISKEKAQEKYNIE